MHSPSPSFPSFLSLSVSLAPSCSLLALWVLLPGCQHQFFVEEWFQIQHVSAREVMWGKWQELGSRSLAHTGLGQWVGQECFITLLVRDCSRAEVTPNSFPAPAELPVGKLDSELPSGCQTSGEELISTTAPHPHHSSPVGLEDKNWLPENKSLPGGMEAGTRELACGQ